MTGQGVATEAAPLAEIRLSSWTMMLCALCIGLMPVLGLTPCMDVFEKVKDTDISSLTFFGPRRAAKEYLVGNQRLALVQASGSMRTLPRVP